MVSEFNLKNLYEAEGGRIDALFMRHLALAVFDCKDRPADKSARDVVIKCSLKPNMPQDGVVDADIEIVVYSKVPKHVSRTINCQIRNGNKLAFNNMSEADYDQKTLDQLGDA